MNGIPTTEILLLLMFFIGAREFWFKININLVKDHIYSAGYFLFWSIVLLLVFNPWLTEIINTFNIVPILVFIAVILISIFVYYILQTNLRPPNNLIKKYPEENFLKLSYRYLFSKSFDILFQQIAVITSVIMMEQSGLNILEITLIFALVFGFLHIRIVQKEGSLGWIYVIASTLAGLIFPYLILNINYGFIYTYTLHWCYYLILGIYFWVTSYRQIEA